MCETTWVALGSCYATSGNKHTWLSSLPPCLSVDTASHCDPSPLLFQGPPGPSHIDGKRLEGGICPELFPTPAAWKGLCEQCVE